MFALKPASFILPNGVCLCVPAHRWPVGSWLTLRVRRRFKWISITENWLARINHNKNGTGVLSSPKDRLPWDTAETAPIICPSEAETIGKSTERISAPEGKIFKRLKYSSLSKGFLPFRVYQALQIQVWKLLGCARRRILPSCILFYYLNISSKFVQFKSSYIGRFTS